jgi:hypothetical protein
MNTLQLSIATCPDRVFLHPMKSHPRLCLWEALSVRFQAWAVEMTLRHAWFRVLLHLDGMVRRPRNIPWHCHHIVHEFHDRKPPL